MSTETGFIQPCATSFWTTDSGNYWSFSQESAGLCTLVPTTAFFSDAPDGANVEKGATAEVVRKGNNPPDRRDADQRRGAHDLPCSSVSTCKLSQPLDQFDSSVVSQAAIGAADVIEHKRLIDFVLGVDVADHNVNNDYLDVRLSVHGDVAHSRPLPVNYGGSTGVVVYYGANDGGLRAVRRRRKGAVGLHRARAPRQAEADARPDPARDVSEHGGAFSDSNAYAQGLLLRRLGGPFPERRQQQSLMYPPCGAAAACFTALTSPSPMRLS